MSTDLQMRCNYAQFMHSLQQPVVLNDWTHYSLSINDSQLTKMKKEYSSHVPAMKFIAMKQFV